MMRGSRRRSSREKRMLGSVVVVLLHLQRLPRHNHHPRPLLVLSLRYVERKRGEGGKEQQESI